MIWVPVAGQGPTDGFRYREALSPLDVDELVESYVEATALIESLSVKPYADLGDWQGHGPALSVYTQWAVYALRDAQAIDSEECCRRLKRLAELQQRGGLRAGYPGLHYGRPAGWLVPDWWGGDIHKQHQAELTRTRPDRYSMQRFEKPRWERGQ